MELRKNPALDLERKRGMFFSIGLFISLSLVLTAFQWKVEKKVVDLPDPYDDGRLFMPEVIATSHEVPKRPEPVKKKPIAPIYIPKKEVEKIEADLVEPDIPVDVDFNTMIIDELPVEVADEIKEFVEQMPEPIGGMSSFYKHLSKNIKYPRMERKQGIQGRVIIQFVVEKDGSLTDLKVLKGVSKGCDEEALRVMKTASKWKPGKQGHLPVRVRMIVPIFFRLN